MPESPPYAAHLPRLSDRRLLVVEDSPDSRETIAVLLQFEGAIVHLAQDGRAGLERLAEHDVDLVVSDLGMPRLDGLGFIAELRRQPALATLPAIALTGQGDDEDIERALAAGFSAHITKPVVLDELVGEIVRLLRG